MTDDANAKRPTTRPGRRRLWLVGALLTVALIWPAQYGLWNYHLKRYQALDEGVVYRTGQPTQLGLRYLVGWKGVKTVLSLQMNQMRLCRGLYDPFDASGAIEPEFAGGLGARHLQWPMGNEWCWPWFTPWQFDEFFKLLDDPANLPLAVHCMGGRHRTGTFSALYRMEYDRWPFDRVLAEMYSFQFGEKAPLQEYNLRTFLPRPRPTETQWTELQRTWKSALGGDSMADYARLVQHLRQARQDSGRRVKVEELLITSLKNEKPFALGLAARCIDEPDDVLASAATAAATRCLERLDATQEDLSVAAALIADFGTEQQQQQLIDVLIAGAKKTTTTPRDEAIVAGVTNRYTPNRLAFLKPLLMDQRHYLSSPASMLRYCDTAVLRMTAILDRALMPKCPEYDVTHWDGGRQLARQWFDEHPQDAALSQLRPPSGHNVVRVGAAPSRVDYNRD